MKRHGLYRNCLKRLLDILLSALALIVLSPLLLVTALLVRVKLGSPVLFRQPRPGMDEKIFYLYKFRSMTNETGPDGRLLPDAQRLPRFGKILRASSLDELPELFNILRGDMSIVGPRPLSIYYLPHYPPELRKRHDVRPGLTGLAQVNGRNNLGWDERFAYDVRYVEELSFPLDLRIVLDTALKVVKHADISVRGTTKVKDYGPYSILQQQGAGGDKMPDMKYSEIGSYFWLDGTEGDGRVSSEAVRWLPEMEDSCFAFSGRNAIDIAVRDILAERMINTVFVPSYCCVSMIQAFLDRGMKVEFFPVRFEGGHFACQLPKVDAHSLVLIMSYFGLDLEAVHRDIHALRAGGAVVIEDITHALLNEGAASGESDYIVASLRKWFAVPTGGWLGKRAGQLREKPALDSNQAVQEKISGMREKYDYLVGKLDSKENALLAMAKFDNDLIHVDRLLKLDDMSMSILQRTDIARVMDIRRENARVLIEGLKDLPPTLLSVPEIDLTSVTPLFVPVFMETGERDSLRRYLIERGIYCPVHWPEVMGAPAGIRENELSLICDHRYSTGDMEAIVRAIHAWRDDRN